MTTDRALSIGSGVDEGAGSDNTTPTISPAEYMLAVALAVGARLAFWLITRREFEDALITAAHAQNAAEGNGLIHHLGDGLVHGFTSAISVLIPLLGEIIAPGSGLNFIRVASLVAGAGMVVVALRLAAELRLSLLVRWAALAFLIFNGNQVLYGMAGMETQIAVFLLLLSFLMVVRERSAVLIGITVGLAVLARPDFVLWAAAVLAVLLIRDRPEALRVFGWSVLVVAPWVVFATLYYGSPLPNTIAAKSQTWGSLSDVILGAGVDVDEFLGYIGATGTKLLYSFAPFFDNSLAVSAPLPRWFALFVSLLVLAFAIRGALSLVRDARWWPVLLFAATYAVYRVIALPDGPFDWYVPPFTAVVILLAARGFEVSATRSLTRSTVAWLLVVSFVLPFPWTVGFERAVSQEIDGELRRPLAEYLDDVASGQSVVAEAAGYIGYYSDVILWDFPGLTSQASRRALDGVVDPSLEYLVQALRPEWIVMRPFELKRLVAAFPATAEEYVPQARFQRDQMWGVVSFQGYAVTSVDESFIVLKRRD